MPFFMSNFGCQMYFVDKNVENAQHGTSLLSSRLFRSDNYCFPNEKKYQIDRENEKNSKIFYFEKFLCIFRQHFERHRGLECFKGSTRKGLVAH